MKTIFILCAVYLILPSTGNDSEGWQVLPQGSFQFGSSGSFNDSNYLSFADSDDDSKLMISEDEAAKAVLKNSFFTVLGWFGIETAHEEKTVSEVTE